MQAKLLCNSQIWSHSTIRHILNSFGARGFLQHTLSILSIARHATLVHEGRKVFHRIVWKLGRVAFSNMLPWRISRRCWFICFCSYDSMGKLFFLQEQKIIHNSNFMQQYCLVYQACIVPGRHLANNFTCTLCIRSS